MFPKLEKNFTFKTSINFYKLITRFIIIKVIIYYSNYKVVLETIGLKLIFKKFVIDKLKYFFLKNYF